MDGATLVVNRAAVTFAETAALALDIEPNPYDLESWVDLEIVGDGVPIARARIDDRRRLWVPLPAGGDLQEIVLRTAGIVAGARSGDAGVRTPAQPVLPPALGPPHANARRGPTAGVL